MLVLALKFSRYRRQRGAPSRSALVERGLARDARDERSQKTEQRDYKNSQDSALRAKRPFAAPSRGLAARLVPSDQRGSRV